MVFDRGLADELRTCAARHVERGVPGLTMLVARDGAVFVEAVGSLGDRRGPTTRDAQYRIASTTKIVTALATLALVEDGRVGLDDPVETFLPELGAPRVLAAPDGPLDDTRPARRSITVRDLLTFTNGFGMYIDMFAAPTPWPIVLEEQRLGLVTLGPPNPTVQPPPDEWIARLGKLPLLAEPGTRFLYNTGASILGVLVGRASGTSFGAYLRGRILDPLAMTETDFYASDPQRLATAYRPTPAGLERAFELDEAYTHPPAFEDGGCGLVATVDDLYALARLLLDEGHDLVSGAAIRSMTSDQLRDEQKVDGAFGPDFFAERSWGYGLAVNRDGSYGWDGGLGTSFLVDPPRQLVVIVLTLRLFESLETPAVHRELRAISRGARHERAASNPSATTCSPSRSRSWRSPCAGQRARALAPCAAPHRHYSPTHCASSTRDLLEQPPPPPVEDGEARHRIAHVVEPQPVVLAVTLSRHDGVDVRGSLRG